MCLIKSSYFPRITLKEKTVYKVLHKEYIDINDFIYKTPIRGCYVELGKKYKGKFKNILSRVSSLFSLEISDGFIHCYGSYPIDYDRKYIIVKCIIPRFTFYFKGLYGEIATRELKYLSNEN